MNYDKSSILVVGDAMIDHYFLAQSKKISPEAPVPIIDKDFREFYNLGGAANVCCNINSLGGRSTIISVVGQDKNYLILKKLLKKKKIKNYLIKKKNIPTIIKKRVICNNSHLLRMDIEKIFKLSSKETGILKKNIIKNIKKYNCIIVSDYGKGTCSRDIIKFIIKIANKYKIPALIDPKKDCKNFKLYSDCYCLKPNFSEIRSVFPNIKNNETSIKKYLKLIKKKHNIKNVILTRSEKGSILLNASNKFYKFKSNAKKKIDVTGAGDTYIASLAFFLTLKKNIQLACKISNETSGITVEHIGTYSVSKKEINKKLKFKF